MEMPDQEVMAAEAAIQTGLLDLVVALLRGPQAAVAQRSEARFTSKQVPSLW